MITSLTQEELKKWVHYNPLTGIFTRRKSAGGNKKGTIAGGKHPQGYIIIQIKRIQYKAHRLAWLYYYGYWPENSIDHRNRIKHNNWILNLRQASRSCQERNKRIAKDNTSGVKGVYWEKYGKIWIASIGVNKKLKHLGRFPDFDEAVCHRLAGEQCLDWNNCDSNSPAYKHVKKLQEDYNGKINK